MSGKAGFGCVVNFGTTTVSITLKDYDGTEYNHTVSVTVKNLKLVRVDAEQNLMLVKGAVPGAKNGLVQVRMA